MIHGEGTAAPDTLARSVAGAVMLFPAVSSLFGTRDQFCGRQFFLGWGTGVGFRMIQVHYIYCALYFCDYYISSTSHQQALDLEVGDLCSTPCPLPLLSSEVHCNLHQAPTLSAFLGFLLPEYSLWHQGYILALPEPCEVSQGEYSWGNLQPWISDLGSPSLLG